MTHEKRPHRRRGKGTAPTTITSPSSSEPLKHTSIRGHCHAFCPVKEKVERAQTQELSRFECPTARNQDLVPVKKYRRAAAGRDVYETSDLRPAPILLQTLQYLFTTVLPWPRSGFDAWENRQAVQVVEFLAVYHFINDRIRSVRQDFTVQRIEDRSLVTALQQTVRFHLLAGLRAMQLLPNAVYQQEWSDTLNDQQLASALSQLQTLYNTPNVTNLDVVELGEFIAYDVLLHANDPQLVAWLLLKLSPTRRNLPSVQRALRTFVALQTDDFYAFVANFAAMSMLERAVSLRHLPIVWTRSLHMMNKGLTKQDRFPLEQLARWMGLAHATSEDDGGKLADQLCKGLNIQTQLPLFPSSQTDSSDAWETDTVVSTRSTRTGVALFKAAPLKDHLNLETQRLLLRHIALQSENGNAVQSSELIKGALRD